MEEGNVNAAVNFQIHEERFKRLQANLDDTTGTGSQHEESDAEHHAIQDLCLSQEKCQTQLKADLQGYAAQLQEDDLRLRTRLDEFVARVEARFEKLNSNDETRGWPQT